jgi:hypothetical protein
MNSDKIINLRFFFENLLENWFKIEINKKN